MYKIFFLFILLFLFSFAWWNESIDVFVYDSRGRPVSNATATVVWQSASCDKHDQITKTTDTSGGTHFSFMNMVEETAVTIQCVERYYTIYASYMGATTTTMGYAGKEERHNIFLPLSTLTLMIKGYGGIPVPAQVRIKEMTFQADVFGRAYLQIPTGKDTDIEVVYGGTSKTLKTRIGDDVSEIVELPVFDLNVWVYDDFGRRIVAVVMIDKEERNATDTRAALFMKFSYDYAKIIILVNGTKREIGKKITADVVDIYFDSTPPAIKEVNTEVAEKKNVKISAMIFDEGKYASGIVENPKVKYSFVGSEVWLDAKMYPTGAKSWEATIPSRGTDFEYKIYTTDGQGNTNVYEGNYTKTPPTGPKTEPTTFEINWPIIFGIAVFLLIVFILYKKIKEEIA